MARTMAMLMIMAGLCIAGSQAAETYPTALKAMQSHKDISLFTRLAEVAGLRPYMNSTLTRATVFAPSNEAILALAKAFKQTPEQLANNQLLVDRIIGNHIVLREGTLKAAALLGGSRAFKTAGRGMISVAPAGAAAPAAAAPAAAAAKPAAPAAAAAAKPAAGGRRLLQAAAAAAKAAPKAAAAPAAAKAPAPKAAAPAAAAKGSVVEVKGPQNSAKVIATDLVGGNVVIHVIDAVVLPDTVFPSLKDALAFSPTATILKGLMAKDPALSKAAADPLTNVTLFVPYNKALAAFAASPAGKKILANKTQAGELLSYHAAKGARIMPDPKAKRPQVLPTLLAGQDLTVTKVLSKQGNATIGHVEVLADSEGAKPATIGKFDIIAGASLVNVIDGVLIPKL